MAALLVSIAVMGVLMSMALPAWRHAVQREKEAELIFRGEQYARAIALFQRKNPGAFPPNMDVLVQQKFLRKKYEDPMTEDGEFQILYQASVAGTPQAGARTTVRPGAGGADTTTPPPEPGQPGQPGQPSGFQTATAGPRGGIVGVASKSKERSIRIYNGRTRYNEWHFLFSALTQRPGVGGRPDQSAPPGSQPGGGLRPGPGRPPGGGFGPPQPRPPG